MGFGDGEMQLLGLQMPQQPQSSDDSLLIFIFVFCLCHPILPGSEEWDGITFEPHLQIPPNAWRTMSGGRRWGQCSCWGFKSPSNRRALMIQCSFFDDFFWLCHLILPGNEEWDGITFVPHLQIPPNSRRSMSGIWRWGQCGCWGF